MEFLLNLKSILIFCFSYPVQLPPLYRQNSRVENDYLIYHKILINKRAQTLKNSPIVSPCESFGKIIFILTDGESMVNFQMRRKYKVSLAYGMALADSRIQILDLYINIIMAILRIKFDPVQF